MRHELTGLTRRELEARLGSVRDAIGPRLLVEHDGPARGNRLALIRSGTGLEAFVSIDRGLDIRDVWWQGRPVAYTSPAGDAAPAHFDPTQHGWLRTWPGGLLTTCGLRNVGEPATDPATGEHFGQHGRITAAAASEARAWSEWQGDRFVSTVAGVVREAKVAGEHLELERRISITAGENCIRVDDVIRNAGHRPEPVLVLYHCNVGWPLLDEDTEVAITSDTADDLAGDGDRVVVHHVSAPPGEWASATFGPKTLVIKWRPDQLPCLAQWISTAPGMQVMSIEPGNCLPNGRTAELAAGRGELLEPGEEKQVALRFEFA